MSQGKQPPDYWAGFEPKPPIWKWANFFFV